MQYLAVLAIILAGAVITVNGFVMKTEDVFDAAHASVNQANVHQIATVLELYYLDHDQYPEVSGGTELVDLLQDESYIKNRPIDPSVFEYESIRNGHDYKLSLN